MLIFLFIEIKFLQTLIRVKQHYVVPYASRWGAVQENVLKDDYFQNDVSLCSSCVRCPPASIRACSTAFCVGWNCHYLGVKWCWMLLCAEKGALKVKRVVISTLRLSHSFLTILYSLLVITRICFHFSCIAVAILY